MEFAQITSEVEALAALLQHSPASRSESRMLRAALDTRDFTAIQTVWEWWQSLKETTRRATLNCAMYWAMRDHGYPEHIAAQEAFAVRRYTSPNGRLSNEEKARLRTIRRRVRAGRRAQAATA